MKKRYSIALSLIISTLILVSCTGELVFLPYTDYIEPIETKRFIENDIYYSQKQYDSLPYRKYDGTDGSIDTYRDLYDSRVDERPYLNMSGTGTQKLLVIPVSFSNSNKAELTSKRTRIQNAFFGQESTTSYESVASFYNQSSYGHLKLEGKVSEWFDLGMTPEELKNNIHSSTYSSRYVASKAVEWYQTTNDDLADFDTDEDGFVDGVFLIYDTDHEEPSDLFWAYTDRMRKNESFRSTSTGEWINLNSGEIAVNGYSWASIDFANHRGNLVDSHVYSHETAHLFGLLDYYSPKTYQPVGFMDLMDSNIGDHTGWSKMILDWVTPYVLRGPGEITIKPFERDGELILIPAGEWNGTPYDEFLLLEFYTPTGLNKYDMNLKFEYKDEAGKNKTGSIFTEPGLKVYHVDARLGYFNNKVNNVLISSLDDVDVSTKLTDYLATATPRNYFLKFLNSNTVENTPNEKPLYHLLERSGKNSFVDGYPATNETLFKNGDSFGKKTFDKFAFNNGAELGYTFEITRLTNDIVTIYFKTK